MPLPLEDLRLNQLEFSLKRFDIWSACFPSGGDKIFEILILTLDIEEPKRARGSVEIPNDEHHREVI